MTPTDLEETAVDVTRIAYRTGYSAHSIRNNLRRFPWWPDPLEGEMNGGNWWHWPTLVQALDEHRPAWRDKAPEPWNQWGR